LQNPKYKQNSTTSPDYFYLDTSTFRIGHFKKILQPVISGMLRNIMLGDSSNATQHKTLLSLLQDNITPSNTTAFKGKPNLLTLIKTIDPQINTVFNNEEMFSAAQTDAQNYLQLAKTNEKGALLEYYKRINAAEEIQINTLKEAAKRMQTETVDNNGKSLIQLSADDVVKILLAWENAAIYKMENYISSSSIIHIVRLLQAQKNNLEKYKTTTPSTYCAGKSKPLEPYCIIGKYGYVISILEQIGYIIRFYNTYCTGSHKNDAKCGKKIKKYMDRIDDGVMRLQAIQQNDFKIVQGIQNYVGNQLRNMQSRKSLRNNANITAYKPRQNLMQPISVASGGRRRTKRRLSKSSKTHRRRRHYS